MISTTTNRVVYNGDGSSATFSFPYEFFAQADLKVYLYNSSAQQATLQTLNTNYTVGGTPSAQGVYTQGGSVIMASSVPASLQVVIYRDGSQVQNYSLGQNGTINSLALVQQLDYLTLICQRLQDQCSRAIKLSDGYGPTFDPTIPPQITNSPGMGIVINASSNGVALGFVFSSYVPNTVIMATGSSILASIGGDIAGKVMTSNGSSAPSWQAAAITVSSGILPTVNGGTGFSGTYTQYSLVYAQTATALGVIPSVALGLPLISQGSSSPTYDKLNLATSGSGILPTVNGGTGFAGPYTQYAVIYASATNALSNVASATSGLPLLAQGSSAPVYGKLDLTLSASGILPVVNGGTGQTASFTDGQLLIGNTSNSSLTKATLNAGAGITITNGNGSISIASLGAAPVFNYYTLSVASSVVISDAVVLSGSSFTVTLPTAVGNTGKIIVLQHGGTNLVQQYTIATTGGQTIGGIASGAYTLYTNGESIWMMSDNANWKIVDRKTDSGPNAYTPIFAPAFGSVSAITYSWIRRGSMMKIMGVATLGTVLAGSSWITTPNSMPINSSVVGGNIATAAGMSVGQLINGQTASVMPMLTACGSLNDRVWTGGLYSQNVQLLPTTTTSTNLGSNTTVFTVTVEIPIFGWQP